MTFWDQHGQEVEISQADQKWLDDAYFTTQQMRLPVDSPRAALSYRVSTKGQVDHDDIPMQKIACRKFAQEHGWRVVLEKAEKGVSGSKVSASKRDVIQELRSEASKGNFDILLVYKWQAVMELEDCHRLDYALDLAQNLRCYHFMPRDMDLADYGKELAKRDGIYPKDELLAACFDAEGYACYKMKRMGLSAAEHGFVSWNGTELNFEYSQPDTGQTMQM